MPSARPGASASRTQQPGQRAAAEHARQDAEAEAREKAYLTSLREIRRRVQRQAGEAPGAWLELSKPVAGQTVRVPRAPFVHWALSRTWGAHLAPPWAACATSGLRLFDDDPFHSDWLLGCTLDEPWNHWTALSDAAADLFGKIQHEYLDFRCAVLSGTGAAFGQAVHTKPGQRCADNEIAIIPAASPDYLEAVLSAAGTITEEGGSVAHLANVAREHRCILVRVPNARRLYPAGTRLIANASDGTVEIYPSRLRGEGAEETP